MPPTLDCNAVMRQLWDFLDEELTSERMYAIREHLALCRPCQSHMDFERAFLDALAEARRAERAPSTLRTRVLEALRREGFVSASQS